MDFLTGTGRTFFYMDELAVFHGDIVTCILHERAPFALHLGLLGGGMVQGRRTGAIDMDGGLPQFSQEEIMSSLLAASELGDEEPEIAANITQQMLHMELEPLSRSMRARLRDIVVRLAPIHFIEVGAGIGHKPCEPR